MSTLYHATTRENAESIMENGFWLFSNDESAFARMVDCECVYLMDNISDAINFGTDNYDDVVIVEVEVDDEVELNLDPEYDESAFYVTEAPRPVSIIEIN